MKRLTLIILSLLMGHPDRTGLKNVVITDNQFNDCGACSFYYADGLVYERNYVTGSTFIERQIKGTMGSYPDLCFYNCTNCVVEDCSCFGLTVVDCKNLKIGKLKQTLCLGNDDQYINQKDYVTNFMGISAKNSTVTIDELVISYAIWFYLGLVISKESLVDRFLVKQPWLVLIIGVGIYVCGRFTEPFVATVGGIVYSFGFALIADKFLPKLLFSFRDYTYQIFLMGIFAQMFVKIVYRHISMPYVAGFVICLLAGLYMPVLVSKIIERINWKPLSLSVGLK